MYGYPECWGDMESQPYLSHLTKLAYVFNLGMGAETEGWASEGDKEEIFR